MKPQTLRKWTLEKKCLFSGICTKCVSRRKRVTASSKNSAHPIKQTHDIKCAWTQVEICHTNCDANLGEKIYTFLSLWKTALCTRSQQISIPADILKDFWQRGNFCQHYKLGTYRFFWIIFYSTLQSFNYRFYVIIEAWNVATTTRTVPKITVDVTTFQLGLEERSIYILGGMRAQRQMWQL